MVEVVCCNCLYGEECPAMDQNLSENIVFSCSNSQEFQGFLTTI